MSHRLTQATPLLATGGKRRSLASLDLEFPYAASWSARATLGESPSPRSCSSMVLDGSQGIMLGGYCRAATSALNDLWVLDLATDTWRMIDTAGQEGAPSPRWGHAAAVLLHSMVVFGGMNGSLLNDMCELHLMDKQWIECKVVGECPQPRRGHSLVVSDTNDKLYLFGGVGRHGVFRDVWSCTRAVSGWHWAPLECHGNIPALFDHTAVVWEGGMWVFGGQTDATPPTCSDMVYRLDLSSLTWTAVQDLGEYHPVPRMRHTASVIANKCAFIGGCTVAGAKETSSEIVIWDFGSQAWSQVQVDLDDLARPVEDQIASPLVEKTMSFPDPAAVKETTSATPDDHEVVFNFCHGAWELAGNNPNRRFDHCAICLYDTIVVWGGREPTGNYCSPGCFALRFASQSTSLASSVGTPSSLTPTNTEFGMIPLSPYSSIASDKFSTASFASTGSEGEVSSRPGNGSADTLPGDLAAMRIPAEFQDPVTHSIMHDPVLACDGKTYDRASALKSGITSPIVADPTQTRNMVSNEALRDAIETWERSLDSQSVRSIRTADSLDDGKVINWTKGKMLGRGAFGTVWVALNTDTGQFLAAKQVTLGQGRAADEKSIAIMRNEITLLKRIRHDHIVAYIGCARTDEKTFTVFMEYVPGGDIASVLAVYGALAVPVVSRYGRQILLGLEYLHSMDILHRDIKGANVLLTTTGIAKLGDFGMSASSQPMSGSHSVVGTPYWMAPEVIKAEGAVFASDVWSFGCTLFEMLTTRPPWANLEAMAAIFHIGSSGRLPPLPEDISPEACEVIKSCLSYKAADRPSCKELLQVEFLKAQPEP